LFVLPNFVTVFVILNHYFVNIYIPYPVNYNCIYTGKLYQLLLFSPEIEKAHSLIDPPKLLREKRGIPQENLRCLVETNWKHSFRGGTLSQIRVSTEFKANQPCGKWLFFHQLFVYSNDWTVEYTVLWMHILILPASTICYSSTVIYPHTERTWLLKVKKHVSWPYSAKVELLY
jgi:hypothetical protein